MAITKGKDGSNIENYTRVMTGFSFAKGTLTNANPSATKNLSGCPIPCTVAVRPNAGDTVRLEYSLDEAATWQAWPSGDVTTYTELRMISGVTDIRITRVSGTSQLSTWAIS